LVVFALQQYAVKLKQDGVFFDKQDFFI
jgi:hypothetical protein